MLVIIILAEYGWSFLVSKVFVCGNSDSGGCDGVVMVPFPVIGPDMQIWNECLRIQGYIYFRCNVLGLYYFHRKSQGIERGSRYTFGPIKNMEYRVTWAVSYHVTGR